MSFFGSRRILRQNLTRFSICSGVSRGARRALKNYTFSALRSRLTVVWLHTNPRSTSAATSMSRVRPRQLSFFNTDRRRLRPSEIPSSSLTVIVTWTMTHAVCAAELQAYGAASQFACLRAASARSRCAIDRRRSCAASRRRLEEPTDQSRCTQYRVFGPSASVACYCLDANPNPDPQGRTSETSQKGTKNALFQVGPTHRRHFPPGDTPWWTVL